MNKKIAKNKIYFSSTTSIDDEDLDVFGLIENAKSVGVRSKFLRKVNWWCLDSGTFSKKFKEKEWKERVKEHLPYKKNCTFVVVPDVVYDYKRTLDRFYKHYEFVKGLGFPCALVTQDGLSTNKIPFDLVDVLFIGGSNDHKLGSEARRIIEAGKEYEKWIHVGRVNSIKRIKMFRDCDSWDGTTLNFDPSDSKRYAKFIRKLRNGNVKK